MQNKAAKQQAAQQYANDMDAARLQRQWDLEDRDEARAYDIVQRDEARAYSRRVLSDLVTDAENAGFNPLSVLRTGGGAGYNAAAGFAPAPSVPLSRTAPTRQAPYGGYVGAAFGDVGDFIAGFDPFADATRERESRLVEAQIANLNASTSELSGRGKTVRTTTARNWERIDKQPAAPLAQRVLHDQDGVSVRVGPGSPAEEWEGEYGEIAGELEGLPRYLRDRVWPAVKNPATYGWQETPYVRPLPPAMVAKPRPARPGQNLPETYRRWN